VDEIFIALKYFFRAVNILISEWSFQYSNLPDMGIIYVNGIVVIKILKFIYIKNITVLKLFWLYSHLLTLSCGAFRGVART